MPIVYIKLLQLFVSKHREIPFSKSFQEMVGKTFKGTNQLGNYQIIQGISILI